MLYQRRAEALGPWDPAESNHFETCLCFPFLDLVQLTQTEDKLTAEYQLKPHDLLGNRARASTESQEKPLESLPWLQSLNPVQVLLELCQIVLLCTDHRFAITN